MQKSASLYLVLLIAAFAPLIEGGTTYLPVFIIRILVLVLLFVYLAGSIRQGSIALHGSPLDPAAVLFLLTVFLSVFIAPYKNMALTWLQLIIYYAVYFYIARAVLSGPAAAGRAAAVVLIMGAVEAAVGLGQRLTGGYRPAGTFFNPDMLAGYISPALLIALSMLMFSPGQRLSRARRAGLAALSVLCLSVVILTGSRGGVASLCAGLFVVMWARFRRWALLAPVVLAALILTAPNPVKDRVFNKDPFAYSRARIWQGAARMMADHPMGVGLGNFKYAWSGYNFPVEGAVRRYGKTASTAHDEYLHIGAETGFAGLAAFLFGVFLLARSLRRSVRDTAGGEDRAVTVGVAGGITAILAHSLFDANLHEPGIAFLLILMACMAMGSAKDDTARVGVLKISPAARPRLIVMSAALVLVMAVWAVIPILGYYYSQKSSEAAKGKDLTAALSMADKAVWVEPGNASHHNLRASVLYKLYLAGGGKEPLVEALGELDEAGRLNPIDADYPAMAARIKYESAVRLKPSGARDALLQSALADILRAGRLSPYDAGILFDQARMDLATGDAAGAAAVLEGLRGLEPNFLAGRLTLAVIYKETGRYGLSRQECYNIIAAHDALKPVALSGQDAEFTKIDIGQVMRLLSSMGGVG